MLVLSRKKGERIVMASCGVTLQVIEVRGNTVRIGIMAPPGTDVVRTEVRDRLRGNTPPPVRG
ncbi:MAG TPA: carbon storage regulator [Gemmataceae bacterium]|nr:carbon storage regulator [Gemmataceae bacterium]